MTFLALATMSCSSWRRRVFSAFELLGQRLALRRAMPSSDASSSRVAMSGVLMRPAALMRGATMNAM